MIKLYSIWGNGNILPKITKLRIFNTNVESALLYAASEMWKMEKYNIFKIQVFVNRILNRAATG